MKHDEPTNHQILDEADCISWSTNTLVKKYEYTYSPFNYV